MIFMFQLEPKARSQYNINSVSMQYAEGIFKDRGYKDRGASNRA